MTDKTELKRLATPIGWFTDDHLIDKSATTYDKAIADRWCEKGWPVQALYDGAVVRDLVAENEELTARGSEMHEDRVEAVSELVVQGVEIDQLKAAIATPESVFVNMKAGKIPKPSLRSMIDLYGEVINGEDAQLLEIAKLRAENEALRKDAERYRRLREGMDKEIIYVPSNAKDEGLNPCRVLIGENADRRIDASMGSDEIPDFSPGNGNKARRRADQLGIDYDAAMGKGE